MSKKLLTLAACAALAVFTSAWLSGAALAGPPTVCGDGMVEGDETCEDTPPNTTPGDGCDENCHIEICGNGFVQSGTTPPEECDDGNTVDDDGCTAPDCQFDCGDTEVDPNTTPPETCEDNNATNGDGCDDDTTSDPRGNCTATACGNGVIAGGTPPEQCEPPNVGSCDANCQIQAPIATKGQQKCINAVNKNLAGVAKAQTGEVSKCVKDTSSGKVADELTCLVAGAKTTKAGDKTTKTISGKKCTGENLPVAGQPFTDATTVNGAGSDEVLEGTTTVLGADPTIALKDAKDDAKCQAEVVKQYNAVLNKWLSAANKAKKSTLKAEAVGDAIGDGIDAGVAADTSLAKAESKANTAIAKKCVDAQVDGLFDCGGANTVNGLTLCVIAAAKEAACNAFETADNIDLTCPSDIP